jgi:hypothetical protein
VKPAALALVPRRHRKYWLVGAATLLAAAVLTGITLISGGRAPAPDAASQSLASPSTPSMPRPSAPASGSSSQPPAPLTYRMYTNQRFGFTILRPASFTVKSSLPDGQGVTWVSRDGTVVLSAYGRENVHGYSPAADELADSHGLRVTYHPIKGNVVTVSGYTHNGRTIVYRRDIVGPDAIDTLYWSYPASARARWDPAVTRTAHAFRPGDVGRTQPGTALTFKTYFNQRFGITALWPASFRAKPPPANGQGETWVSPDGRAVLSVYGANNLSHYSPEEDAVAGSRGWLVTLHTIEGNVVTVSGYIHNRRTIVYRRDVVGPGAIDTMTWTYPASEKDEWAGAVTQTAHAFKAGDVTRVH